jgi:hypothetical protein
MPASKHIAAIYEDMSFQRPNGRWETTAILRQRRQSSTYSCATGTCYSCTGSWQWKINISGDASIKGSTGNFCGVCYVASVRNQAPPACAGPPYSPSCNKQPLVPTACTVTSPLPDPPPSSSNTPFFKKCKSSCGITIP